MAKRDLDKTYADLGRTPRPHDIVSIKLGAVALDGVDPDLVEWRDEADNGTGMVIRAWPDTAGNLCVVLVTPHLGFRETRERDEMRFMTVLEIGEMVPIGVAKGAVPRHVHVGAQ